MDRTYSSQSSVSYLKLDAVYPAPFHLSRSFFNKERAGTFNKIRQNVTRGKMFFAPSEGMEKTNIIKSARNCLHELSKIDK
jgi:hypothetical protein